MLTAMVAIHVVICLFIIGVVLLQASQQANIGSMFGGGASQTVFGSGTQTALGKATTVGAVLFFSTCLMISCVVEKERSMIKLSEGVLGETIGEQTAPPQAGSQEEGVQTPQAAQIPAAPAAPEAPAAPAAPAPAAP